LFGCLFPRSPLFPFLAALAAFQRADLDIVLLRERRQRDSGRFELVAYVVPIHYIFTTPPGFLFFPALRFRSIQKTPPGYPRDVFIRGGSEIVQAGIYFPLYSL